MKKLFHFLVFCLFFCSCSNSKKTNLNVHVNEKLNNFKDFEIIDYLELELGDINGDWETVIASCFNTLDKKILFIDDVYLVTENQDYTEVINTEGGKNIFVNDSLNTVIYSRKPVYDEEQYFEIYCHDFNKINYGGEIRSTVLSKPTNNEIIRIVNIQKKVWNILIPEKKEIEYIYFEKKDSNVILYHYLFKCPPIFDDFSFLELWE